MGIMEVIKMIKMKLVVIIGLLALMILGTGCTAKNTVIHTTSDSTASISNSAGTGNEASSKGEGNAVKKYAHISNNNTVRDVVNHPAFQGFSWFILPLDGGTYDENRKLTHVSSLLPYHGHVNPDAVVAPINYMIDEVNNGETIFYDFYTQQQKQDEPSKKSTGLFFFRGKPGAPFAVVCPGGGFSYVGSVHEGFPYAIELNKKDYNAFVLQYRVGGEQEASEDLAAALSYIFKNADTLQVSTKDYSVWGSSAGARMAADIGSYGAAGFGGGGLPKPGTIVMAYTGRSDYTQNDPPTFVTSSEDDPIANVSVVVRRVNALKKAGVDVEYHKYKHAGHGFGLGAGTDADGWIEYAIQFWEKHMSK